MHTGDDIEELSDEYKDKIKELIYETLDTSNIFQLEQMRTIHNNMKVMMDDFLLLDGNVRKKLDEIELQISKHAVGVRNVYDKFDNFVNILKLLREKFPNIVTNIDRISREIDDIFYIIENEYN